MNSSVSSSGTNNRLAHVDALRGIAMFGILLVNLWSYIWGYESLRYGVLQPDADLYDVLAIAFTAFFAEQKFYPIFAFLFGASAMLVARSAFKRLRRWSDVQRLYRRRMWWLTACGIVHGLAIWFGDILTVYGLVGLFVLGNAIGARAQDMIWHLRTWTIMFIGLMAFTLWLVIAGSNSEEQQAIAITAIDNAEAARQVYAYGNWFAITWQRVQDYLAVTTQSILIVPHVAMLFLLGAWAARAGWLRKPWRHRRLWRNTLIVSLIFGLPYNLWWAALRVMETIDPMQPGTGDYIAFTLLPIGGSLMGAAYVALFMLLVRSAKQQFLMTPVGRMALTNYLMQSLLGVVLFQGWAFGLGATLPPSRWMLVALAIMLFQLAFSHWWLKRHAQGPVENLSRRFIERR